MAERTAPPYPTGAWRSDGFVPAVWAPHKARVELVTHDERQPMQRGGDGWWQASVALAPGTRYAFAVEGDEPRPDPRSAAQPDGVHGFSEAIDPNAHRWQDDAWSGRSALGAVIYELHIGTFTAEGTLDAAIDRLDHLVSLGVDLVELMPVAGFGGDHGWGYDGVALYAVHTAYGGPAALKRFVDAAHARGLGVCLDVVYNHLGPSGNYLGVYGPYFTDTHDTPWGAAVNLDAADAEGMRTFIVDNACRWFEEFHLDALRLDAVHALIDDSDTHVLAELSIAVDALQARMGRPLSLIAESDLNDARMVTPVEAGGLGMTAQWADDVHHAIRASLTGERHGWLIDFASLDALEKVMTDVFVHDGGYSSFREREWGAPVPRDTDPRRFVAFGTTHDQVGNRATGDRPSAVLDEDGLALMQALVLFSPFTPMLFMGEEWGAKTPWQFFTDHREPELADAIREGRRREFADAVHDQDAEVPDPQARATFERSKLDWSEAEAGSRARLLDWVRALIARRREWLGADDQNGLDDLQVRRAEDDSWMSIERGGWTLLAGTGAMATATGSSSVALPIDEARDEIVLRWRSERAEADGCRDIALLRERSRPGEHRLT